MQLNESIKVLIVKRYLVLFSVLLVATPLIFVTNTNELFEFPKTFFIYFVGTFTLAVFLSDLVLKPQKFIKPSLPVLAFGGAFILSTVFSTHIYTSVWGYYTRFNDALMSTLIYIGLYIVVINKLSLADFRVLLKVVVLTLLPVGFYGILQHYGSTDPNFSTHIDRVFSTFGQPNWLAQYIVALLPLSLYLAFKQRFVFWFAVYLVGFSCLWFTYSLSGLLGFMASLGVLVVLFVRKECVSFKNISRILLALLLSVIIAVTNLGIFSARIQDAWTDVKRVVVSSYVVFAQENPGQYNLSDPGYIREGLWKGSLKLATSSMKNLLIGVGPETFPYQFQQFRPRVLNYSSEWDFVFNKPHNYYIELLVEQGLLGFTTYLILVFYMLGRLPKALVPCLVGFLVTNIFGWPVAGTALLFWFFAAIAERRMEL